MIHLAISRQRMPLSNAWGHHHPNPLLFQTTERLQSHASRDSRDHGAEARQPRSARQLAAHQSKALQEVERSLQRIGSAETDTPCRHSPTPSHHEYSDALSQEAHLGGALLASHRMEGQRPRYKGGWSWSPTQRSATGASHRRRPHRHSACRLAPVRWTVWFGFLTPGCLGMQRNAAAPSLRIWGWRGP